MNKPSSFDLLRVWAALTGLGLVVWYFATLYAGGKPSTSLPLLVAGIGGFEAFLFIEDLLIRRRLGR